MPQYRIIETTSNRTAGHVYSSFNAISQYEAINKFNQVNNNPIFTYSFLWLEELNDITNQYTVIHNTSPQSNIRKQPTTNDIR